MPRISKCQQHCSNPEYDSCEDYFKKTVTIPFLDHLHISSRFTNHSKQAAPLHDLPVNITEGTSTSRMKDAIDFYSDDLPNSDIIDEEFSRWNVSGCVFH